MKNLLRKALYAGVILCIAVLAGCMTPVNQPEQTAVSPGKGRVVISIGSGARTIAPDTSSISKFTLSFTGPETVEPVTVTGGTADVELAPGAWTISATGYNAANTPLAEGSAAVTVTGGDTGTVDILLTPKTDGANGTFRYQIDVWVGVESESEMSVTTPEGDVVHTHALKRGLDWSGDDHTGQINQGTKSLPPGEYIVQARLRSSADADAKFAGRTEIIHIYSGLTTQLSGWSFDNADFRDAVSELDLTSRITPPAAWATPAASFSGSGEYSADSSHGTKVAFRDMDDKPLPNGIFLANTVYKAVVTLVTERGYGFTGVAANSFTHSGADTVTNAEDSGVVTIVFPATDNVVVTGVTVTPANPTVDQGAKETFSAEVTGTITPPQTVIWSVSGNNSSGTTITQAGVLTVATTETAGTLTVKAAPIADPNYALGTTTVTVNADGEVIQINTAEDLAKIGVEGTHPLGGKYLLTANLTLSDWVPLGKDASNAFFGTFDGNNKTITLQSFAASALSGTNYLGIFGYAKGTDAESKAELKNLVIVSEASDVTITSSSGNKNAGLLAGYAENAEISGITLSGSLGLTTTRRIYAGGVVGYSATNTSITDCHNTANITAAVTAAQDVYCGGITGYLAVASGGSSKIENCSSTGDITASTANEAYAGGIAGITVASGGAPNWIKGCMAGGNISGTTTGSGYNAYVGGIAGMNRTDSLISQSYFNGTVTESDTNGTASGAGGIAGSNTQGGRIEDCWSHGTVTGFNNAGGIVGKNNITSAKPGSIKRCYSTAGVVRTGSSDTNNGAGGIAGHNYCYSDNKSVIDSCAALNAEISSAGGVNIHRVTGSITVDENEGADFLINNYAWSGITITPNSGSYTAHISADKVDGADVAATKLDQDFYATTLGWDFNDVWEMGVFYPKLKWQTGEISRSSLEDPPEEDPEN
jgi:hypothetical protein